MTSDNANRSLVGVIDEGTTSVRFVIYKSQCCKELVSAQEDIPQIFPREHWVEQDPRLILNIIRRCANDAIDKLIEIGYQKKDIISIGITNQRESVVVWDKTTGEPLYNVISWNDSRTTPIVDRIVSQLSVLSKDSIHTISGLRISPYFSALKMRWLIENVRAVRRASREGKAVFGTIDSWIIWNLTGGIKSGIHITDVTNASRTLLMNIEHLFWDPLLLRIFNIDKEMLPTIHSSSEIYGSVSDGSVLDGLSIAGILGNQQSALLGHMCIEIGQAKNTYRSGCFLLCNTGTERVKSSHGLVTTVAYKLGKDAPTYYALEGSIATAGAALKWLKDKMRFMQDVTTDAEKLARSVPSTADVYFVPALSGLLAPYWRSDARGIICGLTAYSNKKHIIRAALESVCFQTKDILEAMAKDCAFPLTKLHADGKMSSNNLLMELQADIAGIPVFRSKSLDMTALGAAIAAGMACGVWNINAMQILQPDIFLPTTTDEDRNLRYTKWKMAVERSFGWSTPKRSSTMTDAKFRMLSSIPSTLFVVSSFLILIASEYMRSRLN